MFKSTDKCRFGKYSGFENDARLQRPHNATCHSCKNRGHWLVQRHTQNTAVPALVNEPNAIETPIFETETDLHGFSDYTMHKL